MPSQWEIPLARFDHANDQTRSGNSKRHLQRCVTNKANGFAFPDNEAASEAPSEAASEAPRLPPHAHLRHPPSLTYTDRA